MYQFSLDSYIMLFSTSIDKSLKHPRLEERIQYLNDYHTFAVYQYTCRGLFERHKLLFSFQMCAKILEAGAKLNLDEYNFFLRGGVVSLVLLLLHVIHPHLMLFFHKPYIIPVGVVCIRVTCCIAL